MADTYSGFFTLAEEKAKTTLAADAYLATASGTRLAIAYFSDDQKADETEFEAYQLPAIQCEALEGGQSPADDEDGAGGLDTITEHARLMVLVIVQDENREARLNLAKDIASRVVRVLRNQYGSRQLSGLDLVVPGALPGTVFVQVSGVNVIDAGQTAEASMTNRAVAAIYADVAVDVIASLSG